VRSAPPLPELHRAPYGDAGERRVLVGEWWAGWAPGGPISARIGAIRRIVTMAETGSL